MNIALITCSPLPEPDFDEVPLLEALRTAGHRAQSVAWSDCAVDYSEFKVVILRATWDYYHHLEGFLAWLYRVERETTVLNPPEMIRANTHKGYLLELEKAGVNIVPTEFFAQGSVPVDLQELLARRGWDDIVIKPAVGAGSYLAERFSRDHLAAAEDTLTRMVIDRDTMVQAFVPSVESIGERSIVCIGGEVSHAVAKRPRFGEDDESVERFDLTAKETNFAQRVLDAMECIGGGDVGGALYARVDVFDAADGSLMLSELELIEPSLFFEHCPGSADRFVTALESRLAGVPAE